VSYIVESGASSARRSRRRRALITLLVVALMLFFAFWYAYSYYQASGRAASAPVPACTTAAPASGAPKPADTTVNVYNATERNGLAAKTASELRKRGFAVATVANDPLQKKVAGPAEVRYGGSGVAKAKLVLTLVTGARPVRDARTDASVDLVLGDTFTALAKPAVPKPVATKPAARPTTAKPGATTPAATPSTPAC
jgi:hypothetical protein